MDTAHPTLILTTAYWPSVSWFGALAQQRYGLLEANEHYQKGSLRNRCHIAGPNGIQRLSIPLEKGKHQQTPIGEVRISYDEDWQRLHWRSILTAYGNAPLFEHYADELEQFYKQQYKLLFEFNWACIKWLIDKLELDVVLGQTVSYEKTYEGEILDRRSLVYPNTFKAETPYYGQVFEDRHGFLPNLSALDLLLCTGKGGRDILENTSVVP